MEIQTGALVIFLVEIVNLQSTALSDKIRNMNEL